jgi:antitoxin component of MazEF toxin-antitoxin module
MSELMYEVRKVSRQGSGHLSHSIVIPHSFLQPLKITAGQYMRMYIENNERIIMQKVQEPGELGVIK